MFTQNLIKRYREGDLGVCPKCGGDLVETVYKSPIRENIEIECKTCNKRQYFVGTRKD